MSAAAALEILKKRQIDLPQMRHVGRGVSKLRLGQGPPRPVGEAVRFVERIAGDALHQLIVRNRITIAQHHGRDLGVEDRMRNEFGGMPDDFDILARGVKHLHHALVRHQCVERRKIDAGRQRVDHDRFVGRRHLRDAQQRIVGRLAQEFGVDGDERMGGHAPASGGKLGRRRDRDHCGWGNEI